MENEPEPTKVYPWFHPKTFLYRFIILLLACMMTIGAYMALDAPSALATSLIENHGISQGQLSILFAVYSLPNIFLAFVGGVICSRIGYNAGSMLFALLILGGNIISAMAFWLESDTAVFWGLLLGRLVFGSGSESLIVSQSIVIYKWFDGKEMAFAFGLALTIGRLGSIITFWFLPVVDEVSLEAAFWVVNFFCFLSVLTVGLMWFLDVRGNRIIRAEEASEVVLDELSLKPVHEGSDEYEKAVKSNEDPHSKAEDFVGSSKPIIPLHSNEGSEPIIPLDSDESNQPQPLEESTMTAQDLYSLPFPQFVKLTYHHVVNFPLAFWLLILICCAFYGTALSFQAFSADFFVDSRGISKKTAARITSIKTWSAMVLSPVLGFIVDYSGYRVHYLFFGLLALIPVDFYFTIKASLRFEDISLFSPAFLLYLLESAPVIFLAIVIGFSFSLVPAVIWPAIPMVVRQETTDSAFGMSFSVYNASLFFGQLFFGWLREWTMSWTPGFVLFSFIATIGAIAAFFLFRLDTTRHGNVLKLPSAGVQPIPWRDYFCFCNTTTEKDSE